MKNLEETKVYESPIIEIVEVEVECGFALSNDDGGHDF